MKHLKLMGLCLVAIIVIAAAAATSAFAKEPEWGQCYKKAGGKYSDGNCATKSKGEYEWRKGTEVEAKKITVAGGALAVRQVLHSCYKGEEEKRTGKCVEEGGHEGAPLAMSYECTSVSGTGELSEPDLVKNVHLIYKECLVAGFLSCRSEGAEPDEIRTNALEGELGYIDKDAHDVGLSLTPESEGGTFAEIDCEGLWYVIGEAKKKEASRFYGKKTETVVPYYKPSGGGDSIISTIGNVDEMTNQFSQTYTTDSEDESIPNKFEGKKLDVLEEYFWNQEGFEGTWSPVGIEGVAVDTVAGEPVEIKG